MGFLGHEVYDLVRTLVDARLCIPISAQRKSTHAPHLIPLLPICVTADGNMDLLVVLTVSMVNGAYWPVRYLLGRIIGPSPRARDSSVSKS